VFFISNHGIVEIGLQKTEKIWAFTSDPAVCLSRSIQEKDGLVQAKITITSPYRFIITCFIQRCITPQSMNGHDIIEEAVLNSDMCTT
jgi:hypothetical protein